MICNKLRISSMSFPAINRCLVLVPILFMFVFTGCGSNKPQETYPTSGIVQWSNGQSASELTGAMVALEAIEGAKVLAFPTGVIQNDGTFVLKTYQPED